MNNNEEKLEAMLNENLAKIKHKIIVMSGKGGVGKSTVSVNLAYSLALLGYEVGLLDIDIHGPSIGKLTGIENKSIELNENQRPVPIKALDNLHVVTIASMLESADTPIIWRGPMKMGAIKQFLSEIEWPELDYLIVDCPPGTGDEPLSIIQILKNLDGAIIVTTPQDVALLDVKKSINFAKKLNLNIIGIIENMAGFICPHCGKETDIFKKAGAERIMLQYNVDLLGVIPIDQNIVHSGDDGKAFVYFYNKTKSGEEYKKITDKIIEKIGGNMKKEKLVAIPISEGNLAEHFGHCEKFLVFKIEDNNILNKYEINPPEHQPGVLPAWLKENKIDVVISSGIGERAVNLLNEKGIDVIKGISDREIDIIINKYINGELVNSDKACKHNHGNHSCNH